LEVSNLVGNPKRKIVSRRKASNSMGANHLLPSGESTRCSGIYKIEHHSHEIQQMEKEIFVRKGVKLPFCPQCASALEFRLQKKVNHISEDPDFQ
jgi:hypothetical protein